MNDATERESSPRLVLTRPDGASAAPLPREPQPRGAVTKPGRRVNQGEAAARFIASPEHLKMHDAHVWEIRKQRDHARDTVAEWEELRELASQIKQHTLANLDRYLVQFETAAQANGAHVHWAAGQPSTIAPSTTSFVPRARGR